MALPLAPNPNRQRGPDAVYDHIPRRGRSPWDKGLVDFVGDGVEYRQPGSQEARPVGGRTVSPQDAQIEPCQYSIEHGVPRFFHYHIQPRLRRVGKVRLSGEPEKEPHPGHCQQPPECPTDHRLTSYAHSTSVTNRVHERRSRISRAASMPNRRHRSRSSKRRRTAPAKAASSPGGTSQPVSP